MQKKRDFNQFAYAQLVHEDEIPCGIDLMKHVQETRSRKSNNKERRSSNASIKSGSSISHGKAKSALKGSGASFNGQLMPKTAGQMKLTM